MASDIDETFPADNEQVSKATMRAQFAAAKTEIEELQRKQTLAYRIGFQLTGMSGE